MYKRPEILAPAGSQESLVAAVRCGADAVYLGLSGFNARASATNFTAQDLPRVVQYCHQRDTRVYITLNTLVADSEMESLLENVEAAAASGVDAVIVQDLGVAKAIRQSCPDMTLHASTQMTIHNKDGALAAAALGFSRVVAAREMSCEELAALCALRQPEVEVFVHGALCMSVSGQCYLSSIIGERSGNRGRCAQPCRLPAKGAAGEYSLSLKDLSLVDRLDELWKMGVASLKIEGRMKRPEYVAAAVTACRQALEGKTPDFEALRAVFSRQGFTSGYFEGKTGVHMFGARSKEDVTSAAGVLGSLQGLYRNETQRVAVDMNLELLREQPARLICTDGIGNKVDVSGEIPQEAVNRPTTPELAARSLEKTGGTPFYIRDLTFKIDEGIMLPVSALNSLRKQALESLDEIRGRTHPLSFNASRVQLTHPKLRNIKIPQMRIRLERAEQLTADMESFGELISLPVHELHKNPRILTRAGGKLAAELPPVLFEKGMERAKLRLAELYEQGLRHAVVGNIGQIKPLKEMGFTLHGDYGLNIFNSLALKEYAELGLEDTVVSYELNLKKIYSLGDYMKCGIIAYGRLPLMIFRNCPIKPAAGCGGCPGGGFIIDRLGNKLPVSCVEKQTSRLFNPQMLYLGYKDNWKTGLSFYTLYFTDESPEECGRIIKLYNTGGSYPGKKTAGLYYRNVE